MFLRETMDIYFANYSKHLSTLRGENAEFLSIKACGKLT